MRTIRENRNCGIRRDSGAAVVGAVIGGVGIWCWRVKRAELARSLLHSVHREAKLGQWNVEMSTAPFSELFGGLPAISAKFQLIENSGEIHSTGMRQKSLTCGLKVILRTKRISLGLRQRTSVLQDAFIGPIDFTRVRLIRHCSTRP